MLTPDAKAVGRIEGKKDQASPADKLQMAFELAEFAEAVQRQNLKRRHPEETAAEIERRLRRWRLKLDDPIELPEGFRVRG